MKAVILGCGYVGKKLACRLRQQGHEIHCLTASEDSLCGLREAGFNAVACNLDSENVRIEISNSDVLLYFVPPPLHGHIDARSRVATSVFHPAAFRRVVLISTTGVYGDCKGNWVDESWPLNPGADRAHRRVDSESVWRAWADKGGVELSVLRVAGIYAADRLPVKRLQSGKPVLALSESPCSNRIHADDLVSICMVAASEKTFGTFNVADDEPTTMTDYFFRVADALAIARPPEISLAEAQGQLSAGILSYLTESRRIDNTKLKRELGISLRYPTLREGLQQSNFS